MRRSHRYIRSRRRPSATRGKVVLLANKLFAPPQQNITHITSTVFYGKYRTLILVLYKYDNILFLITFQNNIFTIVHKLFVSLRMQIIIIIIRTIFLNIWVYRRVLLDRDRIRHQSVNQKLLKTSSTRLKPAVFIICMKNTVWRVVTSTSGSWIYCKHIMFLSGIPHFLRCPRQQLRMTFHI